MASEARGCSTSRWRAWRAATPTTIDLLKNIRDSRDITMAMIEHDMHLVFSLAGRIRVLARGTPLVEDTPEKIKGHPKVQEPCLGQDLAA